MNHIEQKELHDKITNFQYLTEDERKEVHKQVDSLISGHNGWERIDKFYKENPQIQPYFLEARDEVWRNGNQSLVSMMVITLENILDQLENYKEDEDYTDELRKERIAKQERQNKIKVQISQDMKITNVGLTEKNGAIITFSTSEQISLKATLQLEVPTEIVKNRGTEEETTEIINKTHYFKPIEISTDTGNDLLGDVIHVKAAEIGYWGGKIDNKSKFDIRTLIGLKTNLVTDKETLKKIEEESRYC